MDKQVFSADTSLHDAYARAVEVRRAAIERDKLLREFLLAHQAARQPTEQHPALPAVTIPWNWKQYQAWAAAIESSQPTVRLEWALLSLANCWADLLCFDAQTKQPDDLGKLLARFIEKLHRTNALWNAVRESWPRGTGVQIGHRKKPSGAWAAMECFNDIRQLVLDGDVTKCGIYGSSPVPSDICERFKQLLVQDLKDNGIPHLPAAGIAIADTIETDVMQEAKQQPPKQELTQTKRSRKKSPVPAEKSQQEIAFGFLRLWHQYGTENFNNDPIPAKQDWQQWMKDRSPDKPVPSPTAVSLMMKAMFGNMRKYNQHCQARTIHRELAKAVLESAKVPQSKLPKEHITEDPEIDLE
jgi:hypothetical protein